MMIYTNYEKLIKMLSKVQFESIIIAKKYGCSQKCNNNEHIHVDNNEIIYLEIVLENGILKYFGDLFLIQVYCLE